MKKIILAILLGLMLSFSTPAQKAPVQKTFVAQVHKEFVQQVYNSVVLLYGQDESGGMKMTCTATAYEQLIDKSGYRFVSAAHCVSGKTDKEQKAQKYYITTDNAGEKIFLNAVLIEAGDKSVGDDFSIFEVKTNREFSVIPLGNSESLIVGDKIINVASPYGLGKQYFEGYISNTKLDRPPLDAGQVHWNDVMLIEVGSAGGSSGSAIISEDQRAIVGFLVGGTQSTIGAICIPVNRFKDFEKAVRAGTYKKSKTSDELAGGESQ